MQCDRDRALEIINKRMNDCLCDLGCDIPIDLTDEIKNLKLDLIIFALKENLYVNTHAAKMLNMNRTTMVSMMQNELAPVIRKRKKAKRQSEDRPESVHRSL
jgi:transcriptional regulator with GAF, ATPase, and Fis domain